ncbi:hypothetical protein HDU86_004329 [Geranomyces michiganensis]|nr:hypothetical protein HDU86_004329 [Geranomyces michiganensis]
MSSSQETEPLLAPAAEGTLPAPATAATSTRRRPHSLSILTKQLTKHFKESLSGSINGSISNGGHGIRGLATRFGLGAPAATTTTGGNGAQELEEAPTPTAPMLLPAPLSAQILDAGSTFFNAINPLRSPVEPPLPLPDAADRALEGIVSQIVKDFEQIQCIVERDVIRAVLSDALADKAAIVTVHNTFLANSWNVPDNDLIKLFKNAIDAMCATYVGVPKGTQAFYVRSKALASTDIIILRDHFARRFHHPEFLGKLDALIALASDSIDTVYLRYIGTVRGPSTPRTRYEDDVAADVGLFSKTDLLIKEMRELGELGNESEWTVHEFSSLRTAAAGSSDFRMLFVEKILILLFGRDALINVQPGGFYATYAPTAEDVRLFTSLKTSVFINLLALYSSSTIDPFTDRLSCQHPRLDNIKAHMAKVFSFIKAHPHMVANRDTSETSRIAVDTLHQAIPLTRDVYGGTLVLLVGKDVPLEALDPKANDVRFLFGESRAGHIARSTLKELQQYEQAGPSSTAVVQLVNLLPFVDLYPWLLRHMLARGSLFLATYMQIVRPWVTVTFSGEVTCTIARGFTFYGSFDGQGEAGRKNLLDDVGIPFIASFDPSWTEDAQAAGPADTSYTVGVPHYHPGRDKYGSQPPAMRRVIWLTWVCTFLVNEEAHNVLTRCERGKGKGAPPSRLDLCHEIKKAADDRIAATGLLATLVQAKAALSQHFAAQKAPPVTPSVLDKTKAGRRIKKAIERSTVMTRPFPAAARPKSNERTAQAEALWQRKMLPLGKHMPYNHDPANKARWMKDLKDTAAFEQAFQDRLERMRAGRALSDKFQRAQQSRALLRWGMDPQHVLENSVMALEGQKAQVMERSTCRFFTDVDGKPTHFRFKVPASLIEVTDKPTLQFRADGIHLQDDAGRDLHILPVNRMAFMKAQGPALQRVWQRELHAIGGPGTAEVAIPPTPPGRPLLKWTTKSQNYMKVAPIAEEDAIWLFHEWLDEVFPNSKNHINSHWRDPKNQLLQFPAWIASEYLRHHHRQTWTDLIQNASELGTASTQAVKGSLMALRGALTITQYNVAKLKKSLCGKRWHFEGPRPDSALEQRTPES